MLSSANPSHRFDLMYKLTGGEKLLRSSIKYLIFDKAMGSLGKEYRINIFLTSKSLRGVVFPQEGWEGKTKRK